jgi:hypothetical protein
MNPIVGDVKLEPQKWLAALSDFLPQIDRCQGKKLSELGASIAGQIYACHYNFFIFNQDKQAAPLKEIYERLIPHVRLETRWIFFQYRPKLPPGFADTLKRELQRAIDVVRSHPGAAKPGP